MKSQSPLSNRRPFSRRSFLAATAAAIPAYSASRVLGANERVRVGFIGVGGRGRGSVNWFKEVSHVEVAGLCDVDQDMVDRVGRDNAQAAKTTDLRRLLEDDSIDVVVISTANHWHSLATIWACQAGKDVYVEKPGSHNIWEGRRMVEAARKYDRIVQGGTQQRSDALHGRVKEYLDSGALGAIKYVRLNRYGVRQGIGRRDTPLTPPASVDYDLWLGPAQDLPILRDKFHYDWHWVWNTGNGELGNWGPHILDDMRNVVFRDLVGLPSRVISGGGRIGWDDAGETPNTQFVYYQTETVPVIMSVHNLPRAKGVNAGDAYRHRRTGAYMVVECEKGYYAGGRGGGAAFDLEGNQVQRFQGDGGRHHARNFIDAVRSRDRSQLNAEIEQTHYSSGWSHLGNMSYQLAANESYDRGQAEARAADFEPWQTVVDDFHVHLEANEIDTSKADIRLGPWLDVDVAQETLVGDSATPEALALIRREYRVGYEVPEQV